MISKGVKKYLVNPSLGLLASILYIALFTATSNIGYSLIISVLFAGTADIILRFYTKSNACGLMFILNFLSLFTTLILWYILHKTSIPELMYLVFFEVIFVSLLFNVRLGKAYINMYLGKKQSIIQKTFLGEFFEVAKLTQYGLTFHIFILLIYQLVQRDLNPNSLINNIFYIITPIVILSLIIIYEEVKTRNIVKQLRKEEWLPIVNESGEVTGRIAKSVSSKMKKRFMHPMVRIALIHNGEIYIQKRSSNNSISPSMYDHPFEKLMLFNHEINISVRNSISKALNMQELPFNFLLKYVFENEDVKRLVFLFVSRIENEEQLKSISLLDGKFWTPKQIEQSLLEDNIFSECFQLEYEYLKNTVIQADILKREVTQNN
uniref:hypothetical protein n=1 Tax=uncultured Dysgonomonas sp. TaxID=206096 RepID=UPI00262AF2EE|nr:hypothetical protein [uncultured Dysgonomonas sp.]